MPADIGPRNSLDILLLPLVGGAALHILCWYYAMQTQCTRTGLGATTCDGGLGLTGMIMLLVAAFAGTPVLVATFLTQRRADRPWRLAVVPQVVGVSASAILLGPVFSRLGDGSSLLWEATTQLLIVPLITMRLVKR
jgi:hypothetical protein